MPMFDVAAVRNLTPIWFRECKPKILVVTDRLNFDPTDGFGLTEFVETLRASTIHGLAPTVITALFTPNGAAPTAAGDHIDNFKFADPTHGVKISRYDVVFLLGINTEGDANLTQEGGALEAMTEFMNAGGGVFATGDHETLGAALSMSIPRVRKMRKWRAVDNPPAFSGEKRLTTNLAGADDIYMFNDQSDRLPQRLYPNYRTVAGGVDRAHPLLQVPGMDRGIEVFPDHPHEGECLIPSDLTTKLDDGATDEWPVAIGSGERVAPEVVALTVSAGRAFDSPEVGAKESVAPRAFIAICGYDGHDANVGRVVTDATWHHFVNINIKPRTPALPLMADIGGRDLTDIKQYYTNLASWLMPKQVRSCRRFPWLLDELVKYPLFEEVLPFIGRKLDAEGLRDVGVVIRKALLSRYTHAEVDALLNDALEDAVGPADRMRIRTLENNAGISRANDAGLAALASLTIATAQRFSEVKNQKALDGEETFMETGRQAAASGARAFMTHQRKMLTELSAALKASA